MASICPSSTLAPASTCRVIVPAAVAYSVGLMAATTLPCTETSLTRSPRSTVARRSRSKGTVTVAFDHRWTTGTVTQTTARSSTNVAPPMMLRLYPFVGAICTSCADVSAIFSVPSPSELCLPGQLPALVLLRCGKATNRLLATQMTANGENRDNPWLVRAIRTSSGQDQDRLMLPSSVQERLSGIFLQRKRNLRRTT